MVFENDLNICVSTLKEVTGCCWGSGDKNVYCTVPQDFSSNNGRSEEVCSGDESKNSNDS